MPSTSTTSSGLTCSSSMITSAQPLRRPGRYLQPHHLAPAAAFQRHLEFAHQILGLVLDLKIAVAQHAEAAVTLVSL